MSSYSDTTTQGGQTYAYKVRARDLAGNLSTFSPEATVNTPPTVTVTYPAVADAYVDQAIPIGNFGTLSRIYADLSPNRQAYLKFTVAGLTGAVEKATVRLYIGDGSARGPSVSLADNAWNETGITWSNKPALIGSPLADTGTVSSGAWLDIDVTSAVSTNVDYTFALIPTSADGVSAYSREAGTPSLRPQLIITVRSP